MVSKEKVFSWIDSKQDDLVNLLADLIKIQSVNQGDPNTCDETECAEYLVDLYKKMGLEVNTYKFDPDNKRPNVVGRQAGTGGGKSIIFNAHMDVVPVTDHNKWTHDPFGAEIEDGRIYGRGASDCKAGIAAFTIALQALQANGIKTKGDIYLVPSVGEESCEGGDKGLGPTTKAILERTDVQKPSCVVVGEESNMTVQVETPNLLFFEVVVEGKAVHVSERNKCVFPQRNYIPQGNQVGVDALEKLLPIIEMFYRKERDWNLNWFTSDVLGCDDTNGVGTYSLTPVFFEGGTYLGSMPAVAKVTYALWFPMSVTKDEMMKEIRESVDHIAQNDIWLREHPPVINMPIIQDWPGFRTDKNSDFVKQVSASFKEVMGNEPVITGFKAVCDGTWAGEYGLESIVHGAGDSTTNLHGANENAVISELVDACKVYANIMMDVCEIAE